MHPVRRLTQAVKIAMDLSVLAAAWLLAYWIRFEGHIPFNHLDGMLVFFPWIIFLQYLGLMACGVPRSSWRHVSLMEGRDIAVALVIPSSLLILWRAYGDSGELLFAEILSHPPSIGILVIQLVLGLSGLVGMRVAARVMMEQVDQRRRRLRARQATPTLFIGAGAAGAAVAREVALHPEFGILPLGFLDDDRTKTGTVIHGVRVLGAVADLPAIAGATGARAAGAQQALITIGNLDAQTLRRIVDQCKQFAIPAKIIPGLRQILEGHADLRSIRDVAIEDLLHRPPVQLDLEAIAAAIQGRRILITGAGGSIGSELCRTVSRFHPECLILVEHTENSLFHIHRELIKDHPNVSCVPCMADICDQVRMQKIFDEFRPHVVLHAAAHKHVPMMEWNPGEAIKNNVLGTRTIADLADRAGVAEFVMISTDKAVNPTSVMGATKRIAEIYIQALARKSTTRFVTVRFGNVLGSAGSVIPIFKEQIARGGPVTVTHPEMRRYFMTIPEACQLVLQAATMGRGSEIFILDMGEPVKIVDLARDLIRMSGLSLDEIEIRFTGMRPGEKLFEELSLKEEIARKTAHPKIFIGRLKAAAWPVIQRQIEDLRRFADVGDAPAILSKIKRIVPEYQPMVHAEPSVVRTDREHGDLLPHGDTHPRINGKESLAVSTFSVEHR